jgi:hypothetical protein
MSAPDPAPTITALKALRDSEAFTGVALPAAARVELEKHLEVLVALATEHARVRLMTVAETSTIDAERTAIEATLAGLTAAWETDARNAHNAANDSCRAAELLEVNARIAASRAAYEAIVGTISTEIARVIVRAAGGWGNGDRLFGVLGHSWSVPWEPRDRPMLRARGILAPMCRVIAAPGAMGNGIELLYVDDGPASDVAIPDPPFVITKYSHHRLTFIVEGFTFGVAVVRGRGSPALWATAPMPWLLGLSTIPLGTSGYIESATCVLSGGRGGTHARMLERLTRALQLPAAASMRTEIETRRAALVAAYDARPQRSAIGDGTAYRRARFSDVSLGSIEDTLIAAIESADDFIAETTDAIAA